MASASFSYSQSCDPATGRGIITITVVNANIGPGQAETGTEATITGADGIEYGGSVTAPQDFTGLPNQEYYVRVRVSFADATDTQGNPGTATSAIRTVLLACAPPTPANPPATAINLVTQAPTAAGGAGLLTYTLVNVLGPTARVQVVGTTLLGTENQALGTHDWAGLQPGSYNLGIYEETSQGPPLVFTNEIVPFTIPPFVAGPGGPTVPTPPPAPVWHPVGGVLPNPALLAVPVASLTTAPVAPETEGQPRVGLFVEVELYRPGFALPFALARKTIRTLADTIDVAQYLRAQLVAAMEYPGFAGVLRDVGAAFLFTYRFREIDNQATGPWVVPAGIHYAVLAAMPPTAAVLAPYINTAPTVLDAELARWPVAFPSGEAVQNLGYPLEVGLLLPTHEEAPLYLEAEYYGSGGQLLEIRTTVLDSEEPAGYYRFALPASPLPCAAYLEVVVSNVNRGFAGTCNGVAAPVLEDGLLLTETGFLKL